MAAATRRWPGFLAGLIGLMMALVLCKIGNPVIFKSLEATPRDMLEVLFATWPHAWGYALLLPIILLSLTSADFNNTGPRWILLLPALWLFWAGLSGARSVSPELSRLTLIHFGASVTLFYLGFFVLRRLPIQAFCGAVLLGFVFALWLGIEQHYGGLEATRKAFYELPNWEEFPAEYKLKIASNRIFGPFIYPNTFAGAILIWAPVLTLALWQWTARLPSLIQKVLVGLFAWATVACFFWTGSKAGWLIAIAVLVAAFLHLNIKRAAKYAIVAGVVVLGLGGFAFKYRDYFKKGATSAGARVVYWKGAVQVANARPILGAGPGTFAKTFAPIKPPEAEMARLVHNDYLEQASDSGWPAFILFTAFVGGALILSHQTVSKSPLHLAVWLGLLGWALQSFVEFGLYIPAISWSAFLLLGWLLGTRIEIDTAKPAK